MFTYMARSITNSLSSERPEVYVLEEDVVRVCRRLEPEKGQDSVASKLIRDAFDKYAHAHYRYAFGHESSAAQFNDDDVDPICEQINSCTLATIADEKKNKADDADGQEEECEEEEEELALDAKLVALLTGVFLPPIWYIWYYGLE